MTPNEALFESERAERQKRGLPVDHVLDWSEFPFVFAKEAMAAYEEATAAWYAANTTEPNSILNRVIAALIRKDYAQANTLMEQYQLVAPDGRGRMRFGMSPEDSDLALPRVEGSYPKGPALFFCCDRVFFKNYAQVLLVSVAMKAPGTPVHIHLMDPDAAIVERVRALPLEISCTNEDPFQLIADLNIDPGRYFGAVRMIRYAEALEHAVGPLIMADVDALVTGDPRQLFIDALGMRVRAGRLEPWNQYSACLLVASKKHQAYFNHVASLMKADLPYAWWGMDQYALFSAALAHKPCITLLGPEIAGVVDDQPGLFWFTAGSAKPSLLTDQTPYAKLYRKYAGLPA